MPVRAKSEDWREVAVEVGRRVREYRERLDLSQEELAHKTGIARNQIQNIEHGRGNVKRGGVRLPANPTLDTMYRLARVLEVEVSDLLPHDGARD